MYSGLRICSVVRSLSLIFQCRFFMIVLCLPHAHGNDYYLLPGLLCLGLLRHLHRLTADAALALYAFELATQFPVLVGGDMVEVLADYPGVMAQ